MAYSAQRACSCFGKMGEKSAIRYSRIQNAEKQDKKVGKEIGRAKPKYIKINDDTIMKDVLIRVAIDIQCPKDQWM